jgi:hypothetical protein
MNQFVHRTLHHFLMGITDGEGNDLGGEQEEQLEEECEEEQEEQEEESDEDDVVVTIAGEKQPEEEEEQASAPTWVKDLRKQHREAQKTIRELQAQLKKPEQAANVPVLGKKPSMEDDDIDWDAEKFEQRLTEWHDRKRDIEQHQHQQQQAEQQQKTEWEGRLNTYNTAKTGLKVKDFEDAEENVRNLLDVTQQGIIIQGADNSALVVYALGKNPKKAAELAGIKDAVKFAFAIAKLETQLKVQNKKSAPPPEKTITGTGRVAGSTDSTLERLRAEAEKTGDMSKVMQYKREQKRKQKS